MKFAMSFVLICMVTAITFGQEPSAAMSAKTAAVFLTKPVAPAPTGGTLVIPVYLTTLNENANAFSWSINFDPAVLTYAGYFVLYNGATCIPNEQQVTSGKVGYIFGLPSAGSFPAGTTLCYLVYFKVAKSVVPEIGVGDQPIAREVVDTTPKKLDADFVAISTPVAEFFAGPYLSFGPEVTISIVWSSYPAAIWRIDYDGTRKRVDQCIILPNNSRKCTDTPKGGGRVHYYLEWDVGIGKLQSTLVEVRR